MGSGPGNNYKNTYGSKQHAQAAKHKISDAAQKALLTYRRHVNEVKSLLSEKKISVESIRASPEKLCNKGPGVIAAALREAGYETKIRDSTKSTSGAKIIEVTEQGTGNISQVQCSPGGGRHGKAPYVKISTTNQGIIKVVNGSPSDYSGAEKEKATVIFRENDKS